MFWTVFWNAIYLQEVWSVWVLLLRFVRWDQSRLRIIILLLREDSSECSTQCCMNFEVFWSWWEQMLFWVLYESWMLFPLIPLSCCWPDLCIFLIHTCWSVLWWIPMGDTFSISRVLSLSRSLLSSTLSCKFWLSRSPWVLSSVSPSPRAFQAPPSFPLFYFPAAIWKLTKTVR